MRNILDKLFDEINQIITLEEIAYLGIEHGELIPVYKNDTERLPVDSWISFHKEYRSFVKDSDFLTNLVTNKQLCAIVDTDLLPRKPREFQVLGIKSIYLFPVIKADAVIGILDIAFINHHVSLSSDQIKQCEQLLHQYIHHFH